MSLEDHDPASPRTATGSEWELEGSSYQTAPFTSLALARWTWAVLGLLLGTMIGLLASTGGQYRATASVQLNRSGDATSQKAAGQSLANVVTSHEVLGLAVTSLRADATFTKAGGRLPKAGANGNEFDAEQALNQLTSVEPQTDSGLVAITVVGPATQLPAIEANAIADAVLAKNAADARALIKRLDAAAASLTLPPSTSGAGIDPAQAAAIGQNLGAKKADVAFGQALQLSVNHASSAESASADPLTMAPVGAAGGAFLGALAAVAAGAGRRKPHSPRELMALAPDLTVRTTVQAGELAGRILETDRRSVAVLAMPDTRFAATQLAMAIAHHLRTHGATVAVVDRVSELTPPSATEDRLWALRRDVRRNIPAHFSADLLVVICWADEEALSLIAGQSDLLVAVVAKQRKTRLADVRRTTDAVRISEPVVVLAR